MEKYRYAGGGLVGPDNKDKTSKAAMIDYQFVSFDILLFKLYFYVQNNKLFSLIFLKYAPLNSL